MNYTLLFKLLHDKHCIFASILLKDFVHQQIEVKIQYFHVNDLKNIWFTIHVDVFCSSDQEPLTPSGNHGAFKFDGDRT